MAVQTCPSLGKKTKYDRNQTWLTRYTIKLRQHVTDRTTTREVLFTHS
jgi:hypothetical protein